MTLNGQQLTFVQGQSGDQAAEHRGHRPTLRGADGEVSETVPQDDSGISVQLQSNRSLSLTVGLYVHPAWTWSTGTSTSCRSTHTAGAVCWTTCGRRDCWAARGTTANSIPQTRRLWSDIGSGMRGCWAAASTCRSPIGRRRVRRRAQRRQREGVSESEEWWCEQCRELAALAEGSS